MKTKIIRSILLLAIGGLIASQFTACTDSQVTASLPAITVAASLGTSVALTEAKAPAAVKNDVYNVSYAVYTVTGGTSAPTVAMLQSAISKYVTEPVAADVGSLVTSLYAQYYPKLSGNAQLATQVLNAIAQGVEEGAGGAPIPAATTSDARRIQHAVLARLRQIQRDHGEI